MHLVKLRKLFCIHVIACIAYCMLLRNGKAYSSDHLECKLDLILKELKDLKLKVEGSENKNDEEN